MRKDGRLNSILINPKQPGTIIKLICKEFLQCFFTRQTKNQLCINTKQFRVLPDLHRKQFKNAVFFNRFACPLLVYYIDLIHPGNKIGVIDA